MSQFEREDIEVIGLVKNNPNRKVFLERGNIVIRIRKGDTNGRK